MILSLSAWTPIKTAYSPNFNILLQFSKYSFTLRCSLNSTIKDTPSPDNDCMYTVALPVGSDNVSRYPTHNIHFGLDLTSSSAIISNNTVTQVLKCGVQTDFKDSGCFLLSDSSVDCSVFGVKGPCKLGLSDALLFNHSYDYMPNDMIDASSLTRSETTRLSEISKTTANSAKLPFVVPSFYEDLTFNLLGLSPKTSLEEFVKNIYTVKNNEFSFVIAQGFYLEIMPNLLPYNFIFEQKISEQWQLENFTMGNMGVEEHKVVMENGSVPVCISLVSTATFAIKNRDAYVKRLMTLACNYDQCEYTDENIKKLGSIVLNYTDPNLSNTQYMLRLSAEMFALKRVIMGKTMIELNIADIDSLIKKHQCSSKSRVALGISFFPNFMFQFVFGKKVNYIRFYDANAGFSIREKFHLLNFGGFLALLVMLAISIRVAYKYI